MALPMTQLLRAAKLRAGGQLTQIVTCNPKSLEDALVKQFQQLGEALGVTEVGEAMAQQHYSRLQQLKEQARVFVDSNGRKAKVLMVEWLEPLFLGTKGWMREIDGGEVDEVVVALCGLSLDKTETELLEGRVGDWWTSLLKVEAHPKVFIVDGTSMFTRLTRRLLVALEWLVHALHEPESGWMKDSTFPYKLFDTSLVARDSKAEETKSAELLEIEELHQATCTNKQAIVHLDGAASLLWQRCPYGHANVKDPSRRKNTLAGNIFLQPRRRSRGFAKGSPGGQKLWPEGADAGSDAQNDLVVMFWSGGKDSFLALGALYESYAVEQKPMPRVVLLTTIDPKTNVVPIQDIPSQTIAAQAEALELPLCLVAVGLGDEY
ncbi:hypothetical protein PHYSODRAFT_342513 [Phytophthora sojae]|uniref:Diphthine--ammonia ligase n=1 Tax=Phytophthora sojae (strain P6497) TaxID=1094619 RepID=G5AGU0_PHYSP|nr:hypothetical protein PHYSODRAFT_342513 [Phytophthora sojae]EGZ05370.1 hypothetical protein PHYSODRAFT_342513 [Phytophthora sojae]|eukprot:XP_009539291.1 hypothetical protein PHYSODRAFT_342513 [Phytophthora sojae]